MVYREERRPHEVLSDTILALCMLELARQHGSEGDRLKAMKMLFLAEYEMFGERIKGLNMRFYRHQLGPYADEAQEAWDTLAARGLIIQPAEVLEQLTVTEQGNVLAGEFFADVLQMGSNQRVGKTLLDVAEAYGAKSTEDILDAVYKMRVETLEAPGRRQRIKAITQGTFTRLIEEEEAALALQLPEEWIGTLAIEFNEEHRALLEQAVEDLNAGRISRVA